MAVQENACIHANESGLCLSLSLSISRLVVLLH